MDIDKEAEVLMKMDANPPTRNMGGAARLPKKMPTTPTPTRPSVRKRPSVSTPSGLATFFDSTPALQNIGKGRDVRTYGTDKQATGVES